jgi:putative phage-type endonuclease
MLSQAQIEARRSTIGASEIAALVGLSPWKTPFDVWSEKTGKVSRQGDTVVQRAGHYLESTILQMYADSDGVAVHPPQNIWPESVEGMLVHPTIPYLSATPDGIAAPVGAEVDVVAGVGWPVDAKNVGFFQKDAWATSAPSYYLVQILQQMDVTGLRSSPGKLAALIGGQELLVREVEWDAEIVAMLHEAADEFWHKHVLADIPPPIDGGEGWSRWLAQNLPKNLTEAHRATPQEADLARQIIERRAHVKTTEDEIRRLENELKAQIGASKGAFGEGWRAAWQDRAGSVSWKTAAEGLTGALERALRLSMPSDVAADTSKAIFTSVCDEARGDGSRVFSITSKEK